MKKSGIFKLNTRDLIRGLIVAALAAFLTGAIELFKHGLTFTWDAWQPVVQSTVGAIAAYLLLNLATNSVGEIGKEDQKYSRFRRQ